MPSKRKRAEHGDASDETAGPQTPKKPRRGLSMTPKSTAAKSTRRAQKSPSKTSKATAIDDENDTDDLVADQSQASPVLGRQATFRSTSAKMATTTRTRTPRKTAASTVLNDTPTKSTSKRPQPSRTTLNLDVHDEEDPAAALILQVAGHEGDSQDSEDEDGVGEDDEDEDEDGDEHSVGGNGNGNGNGVALQGGFESYFERASRKQKTSNNTLSKLPVLPHREYLQIIGDYELPYREGMRDLYSSHVKAFPEWSFEMDQSYSICLSGYGSKKSLIEEFCAREAATFGDPYVVVNGYHPSVDLRQVCGSITAGLEATGSDVEAVMEALEGMRYERLVLAIHNIDGPNLRNGKVQASIATIVAHPAVRMVCSIDHVNAPLLFSSNRANDLRLLFHDATTFEPYTVETQLQPDVLSQSSAKAALLVGDRGVKWILQTLSQNARLIFRILLLEQIETGLGMDSTQLFERASAAFAVSNKTSYNAQMGEFLDHEIIVTEKGGGGGEGAGGTAEVLKIPFSKEELVRLLEDIDGGDVSD